MVEQALRERGKSRHMAKTAAELPAEQDLRPPLSGWRTGRLRAHDGRLLASTTKHSRRWMISANETTSIDDRTIVNHPLTGFAVRCELHLLSQVDSYLYAASRMGRTDEQAVWTDRRACRDRREDRWTAWMSSEA
jgi:hypothetical protein